MGYSKLQLFPTLILLTLCFNLTFSAGEILDHHEDPNSEEFENALVENDQKDYQNGCVELGNFVNSINNTFTALKREIGLQQREIVRQQAERTSLNESIRSQKADINELQHVVAEMSDLKSKISDQKSEIANLTAKIASQQEEIGLFKQAVIKWHKLKSNMSLEDIKEFIGGKQTEIRTGSSFNGSTLSQIKTHASQVGELGSYTVIVFANHLDEAIQDFNIYDPYNYAYNPAPKSIPPHTQEIFTFAKPTNSWVFTSFSYAIPSARVRIAAATLPGEKAAGLAFVFNDTDMGTYYWNKTGIVGSWVYEKSRTPDQNLSVSYKNLYARMFAEYKDVRKATVRIELTKLPLLD